MIWNLAPPPAEEMAALVAALEVCWPKPTAAATDARETTSPWRWSGRWWGPAYGRGGAAARNRPWRG